MQRPHDIRHYGFRGVVNSSALSFLGIVFSQKRFIEVHNGISRRSFMEDFFDVSHGQDLGNIVNNPLHLSRNISHGYEVKHVPQNTNCPWDQIISQFPVEDVLRAYTSGKETIGNGLSVNI